MSRALQSEEIGGEEMLEDARIPADQWLMLPAAI